MILETLDFTAFFNRTKEIFSKHFSDEEVNRLMEFVEILADANFRCYKANMIVIQARKDDVDNHKLVSEMEWVARSVGEYRVSSKARINRYISQVKSIQQVTEGGLNWTTDDIVYSIGEMMDRLSIEVIKREDFAKNNRPKHMSDASQTMSNRVERFLKEKLKEIDHKGFYECVHEQRTYDLEGIVKDLAL